MLRLIQYDAARSANTRVGSQAMIVQGHCQSVLAQIAVDLTMHPNLKSHHDAVNSALNTAKANANFYLNTLQPRMIGTLTDMNAFFGRQLLIANLFNNAGPTPLVIKGIKLAHEMAVSHEASAKDVLKAVNDFRTKLSADGSAFGRVVATMETAVNADGGAIDSLNTSISDLDSRIKGAIAGIVLGGITIIGGAFVVAIGTVASFVTAGTSGWVALAGVGIAGAGIAAVTGSSIALSNLLDSKSKLILQRTNLQEEIKVATGLKSTYGQLTASAIDAALAAQQMANAWGSLAGSIGTLAKTLESGADPSLTDMFDFYGYEAKEQILTVQADIATIKSQLHGVKVVQALGRSPSAIITEELAMAA